MREHHVSRWRQRLSTMPVMGAVGFVLLVVTLLVISSQASDDSTATATPVDDHSASTESTAESSSESVDATAQSTSSIAPSPPDSVVPETTSTPVHGFEDAPTEDPMAIGAEGYGFSPGSMLLDLSPEELAADLDRMNDLGSEWIRMDIDWSRIEQERGTFDWTTTDEIVAAARMRDIHVVGLLVYTPTWARPEGTPDKAPPVDLFDFQRFVENAVDRYGDHIRVWEIWNEPNVQSFWFPEPDPHAYGQLLNAGAAAIRAIDSEAIVVTGGLAPAADVPGIEVSPATFLEQLYDVADSDAFDAVGVHPYTYPGFPSETQDWNLFAALPTLREIMTSRGDESKSMWLTEFGAPTGQGERAVSEADQARMIGEALRESRELSWTGPIFIYSLRDLPDGAADDIEANFGVLQSDGADKPAASELRALAGSSR